MERSHVSTEGHADLTSHLAVDRGAEPRQDVGHVFDVNVQVIRMGEDRTQGFTVMMICRERSLEAECYYNMLPPDLRPVFHGLPLLSTKGS